MLFDTSGSTWHKDQLRVASWAGLFAGGCGAPSVVGASSSQNGESEAFQPNPHQVERVADSRLLAIRMDVRDAHTLRVFHSCWCRHNTGSHYSQSRDHYELTKKPFGSHGLSPSAPYGARDLPTISPVQF